MTLVQHIPPCYAIFFFNFASAANGVCHYHLIAVVYITCIDDNKAVSLTDNN